MTRFLHISDLHIRHRRRDNADLAVFLGRLHRRYPDHWLIITGDITDDGRADQYSQAVSLLRPWEGRLIVCPGNHDYGALGNFYQEDRAKMFEQTFPGWSQVKIPHEGDRNVQVIPIDSCLKTLSPLDFACGSVSLWQLKELDWMVGMRPESGPGFAIVILHHHPLFHSDPTMRLLNSQEFLATIAGRCDLLMFGHRHQAGRYDNQFGIPHILAAGSARDWHAREIVIDDGKITVNEINAHNQD